jgi:hypothetical protein
VEWSLYNKHAKSSMYNNTVCQVKHVQQACQVKYVHQASSMYIKYVQQECQVKHVHQACQDKYLQQECQVKHVHQGCQMLRMLCRHGKVGGVEDVAVSVHPGLIVTHLTEYWVQKGDVLGRFMLPFVNLVMRPLAPWIFLPVQYSVRTVLYAASAPAHEVRLVFLPVQ